MSDQLPHGWAMPTIGDVCASVSKRGPDVKRPTFRYIDLGAIDRKSKAVVRANELQVENSPSRARQIVHRGDVLFSNVRVYLENIAQVPDELDGEVASTAFCVLRPKAGVEPSYLYYYVTSKPFIRTVDGLQRGNSPPSVQDGDVKSQSIPVAPTPEQKRIVSKIDELFSRIDEGERALERVSKLVERYRQSVLKAAVTGELSRDWREQRKAAGQPVESGEALLARILTARREAWKQAELAKMQAKGVTVKGDAWKQKYKEPFSLDTTDLAALPAGWIWVSMDTLTKDFLTGPFGSSLHKSDYIQGGIPLVNPVNLRGGTITPDAAVTVSSGTLQRLRRYELRLGDVVLARRGEMGRCAPVTAKEEGWMCGTGSAILRCTDAVLPHYAALAISLGDSRSFLEENCAGTTMHNLNQDAMARVPIPVSSVEEQRVVLDRIQVQMTDLDVLTNTLNVESKRSDALRQAVLRDAFRGGLTKRELSDEPAAVLLECIAAARTENRTAAPKRGRKKKSA